MLSNVLNCHCTQYQLRDVQKVPGHKQLFIYLISYVYQLYVIDQVDYCCMWLLIADCVLKILKKKPVLMDKPGLE